MTYQQLLAAYKQQGGQVNDQAGQDAFNAWTNQIMQANGVGSWEALPDDAINRATSVVTGAPGDNGTLGTVNQGPPTVTPPVVPGANTSQVQIGAQTGAYNTAGTTNGTQAQTGGQTATGTQDQTAHTQGYTQSEPIDTLGFGALLQGGQAGATANDATRNNYLTDLVNTGGANQNAQFDAAIRSSLTGPQATGAGDSARGRIAGDAAANVARNNTGQRLQAAQQLAGPTAVTQLSQAANPYVGQVNAQDTSTNTAGTTSTSGTNFSNLVNHGSENTSGTATGNSSQAASGIALQNQAQSGGGGCVLCTAAIELDLPRAKLHRVLRVVISHKLHKDWKNFRHAARGYFFLFTPLARWLLSHPRIASILWPVAKAVVYEELRVAGRPLPRRLRASVAHWVGHGVCSVVGRFPVSGRVNDKLILSIARRENILFEVLP